MCIYVVEKNFVFTKFFNVELIAHVVVLCAAKIRFFTKEPSKTFLKLNSPDKAIFSDPITISSVTHCQNDPIFSCETAVMTDICLWYVL